MKIAPVRHASFNRGGSTNRALRGGSTNRALLQTVAEAGTIVGLGQPFAVGPWRLTVAEVRSGDEAAAQVQEANAANAELGAAPEGLVYLTVRLTVESTSDTTRAINVSDFAATGSDGVLRRPPTIDMPEPALQGVVEPGASLEGWIPFLVDDPATATLWFDSPFTAGNWAEAIFALSGTSALPDAPAAGAESSDAGADPARPVAIGETVRTDGWNVTIEEIIYNETVVEATGGQLPFIGVDGAIPGGSMVAVRVSVTNVSPYPAFFSTTALQIAGPDGDPWDHTVTLTPPDPDVSQEYLPGASGNGWAAFELASYASTDLIRIQPAGIGGSPRYVAFEGGGAASDGGIEATVEPIAFAAGDTVQTTEEAVNLRAEPSASAEIVSELVLGTELAVTGEPEAGDGYTWYPVEVIETSESGFVAQDFIAPAN